MKSINQFQQKVLGFKNYFQQIDELHSSQEDSVDQMENPFKEITLFATIIKIPFRNKKRIESNENVRYKLEWMSV